MLKKCLFVIISFVLSFYFVSCNFLNGGSQLKNELDTFIDYQNQPEVTIRFSSEGGSLVPSGDVSYKVTGSFFLSYDESSTSKKCFVCWEVYNRKTKVKYSDEDVKKYLKFDDINSPETNVKILANNQELGVRAKSIIRPSVAAPSPTFDAAGVHRDRRIDVLFTRKMDLSSIYYDENEIQDLIDQGYTLKHDEKRNDRCYGYEDSEGNIFFKNIKITNRTNEDINYLKHFEAPYFEELDSSILRINVDVNNPPPTLADIYVTIENGMFYKDEINKLDVAMADDFSWSYYTNSLVDKDAPVFVEQAGDTKFQLQFAKDNQNDYDSNQPLIKDTALTSTEYKLNNMKNHKFWLKGSFYDGGSGPERLEWNLYKINSPYYPETSEKKVTSGKVDNLLITGSNARIGSLSGADVIDGTCIDIRDFTGNKNLQEGTYRIDFIAYDKNQRSSSPKSFYFVHDITPPKLVTDFSEARYSATSATITVRNPNYDVQKIVVKTKNKTNASDTVSPVTKDNVENNSKISFTVNGLKNQNKYAHTFELTDICGNTGSYSENEFIDTSKPEKVSEVSVTTSYAFDVADIKITNSSSNYSYSKINNISFNNNQTKKLSGLGTSSRKKTLTITDYDYSGNYSTYTKEVYTYPSVGMIVYSDKYWCDIDHRPGNKTAVGVICEIKTISDVRIWDLYELTGYCWGGDQNPTSRSDLTGNLYEGWIPNKGVNKKYPHGSGLSWYNLIKDKYSELIKYTHEYDYATCGTVWGYCVNKNSSQSTVTWYIPGLEEFKIILDKYSEINPAFTTLGKTCVSTFQPYWTAMPRYKKEYAYVGSFGDSAISSGTDWKLYENSSSPLKAFWCTSDEREGSYYFKWNWRESYNSSGQKDIYVHAMGQVNLNN